MSRTIQACTSLAFMNNRQHVELDYVNVYKQTNTIAYSSIARQLSHMATDLSWTRTPTVVLVLCYWLAHRNLFRIASFSFQSYFEMWDHTHASRIRVLVFLRTPRQITIGIIGWFPGGVEKQSMRVVYLWFWINWNVIMKFWSSILITIIQFSNKISLARIVNYLPFK